MRNLSWTYWAECLSSEAFDKLNSIDDYWSPEDMSENEDMELLQTATRLTSNRKYLGPVSCTLRLIQTELKKMRLEELILFPPLVEPNLKKGLSISYKYS